MIGLATSTYYHKPKRSREARERADADLRDAIEEVQSEFPRAGYRTVQEYLRRGGTRVGERRLRRVMREYSLHAEIRRAFVVTTDSKHSCRVYPNLLPGKRLDGINQAWAADLSYIRIVNGFVYLAVILDLFSRKVVGWAISRHIDAELALAALRHALASRRPPRGRIHHSDRGVQYLCEDYVALLNEHGFAISNSAKGNPYHNAFVESFIKTIKQEEVYLANYETYLDVLEYLPAFIEQVYNEKRVHSGIGYMTPSELEKGIKIDPSLASRFELQL
jgi:transposase InsO family protein